MSLPVTIQSEAEADIAGAFDWYEARRTGLGHELLAEVGFAFTQVAEHPLQPPLLHRGTRRVRLRRFPYIVLYLALAERVIVLAILHERRNPRLFLSRAGTSGA